MSTLLYKDETFKIIGSCMRVHSELGSGFLESVYHEALEREFKENEVPYKSKEKLQVFYKDEIMNKFFVADFVCFDKIIIELKASNFIHKTMELQTVNYLKTTKFELGLLINFGESSLMWKRFINTSNPLNPS